MRYQSFGIDDSGLVTHAGVSEHDRMNLGAARRIQEGWELWRAGYLAANAGDYPLRAVKPTVALVVHPVGEPGKVRRFPMTKERA